MIAEEKRDRQLIQFNVRISRRDRRRLQEIARQEANAAGVTVSEAEVVRKAISLFLSKSDT